MKALLSLIFLFHLANAQVCNIHCDNRDWSLAQRPNIFAQTYLFSRIITLYISDPDNMGFARIENGDPSDQVWLDRSFDGGFTWTDGSQLGLTAIPSSSSQASTNMFNVDDPSATPIPKIGALRACGKAGDRDEIACTEWSRSNVNSETRIKAGVTALMQFYNNQGLWSTTGWWNSANCLTALIDYILLTGDRTYEYAIDYTFETNKNSQDGDFTNHYIDDTLWWGLAWVRAYDLTKNQKYLDMAQIDADYCYGYRDDQCGGGLWWTRDRGYKNAVTNELFIKLAAQLHNRIPGDTKYLAQTLEVWNWFKNSGMINSENLINDGLDDQCQNNGDVTWTYNQGIILGALVEINLATGDMNYTRIDAKKIADAVINSQYLSPGGILKEPCESSSDCGGDGPSFKGVFMRNLGELDRFTNGRPYWNYIRTNVDTIWDYNRNLLNQFGLRYIGPFDKADGARQHSALEAFIAAE